MHSSKSFLPGSNKHGWFSIRHHLDFSSTLLIHKFLPLMIFSWTKIVCSDLTDLEGTAIGSRNILTTWLFASKAVEATLAWHQRAKTGETGVWCSQIWTAWNRKGRPLRYKQRIGLWNTGRRHESGLWNWPQSLWCKWNCFWVLFDVLQKNIWFFFFVFRIWAISRLFFFKYLMMIIISI